MFVDTAFILTVVTGLLAGLATVYYSIRLPFHGKTENLHGWFRLNPFNAIIHPDKLSPQGLVLRKRLLLAAGAFLACVGLGVVLGLAAKSLG